jgi:LuxR family transcriptional regulator, maltose regulon positive regulatory protein
MARSSARHVAAFGKLAPPRLGRVFDRQRLFAQLDAMADRPALWLGAAPGAGKSTLISTWLQARQRAALWLQLDAGDADPATFVHSLDGLFTQALLKPPNLPSFRSDDLSDLSGWLRRRVRLYLQHVEPPWVLVLDNHQEIPRDSPLHGALAHALSELPPGVQCVFISREAPTAAYARALTQQQLAVIDAIALRFDDSEALSLTRLHGRPDAMSASLAAAQGWVGGMTLMLLGSPSDAELPTVDARERLFDYFAEEVMARMPAQEQHALCVVAYLPSATGEMAVALSGYADAAGLLERLAAQSLFTDRRHSGSATAYVFHDLFSVFLRKRYERTYSLQERQALQQRAGLLLVEHGQLDAGLQRLIDAKGWSQAKAVLQDAAAAYVHGGRTQALRQHIDQLPDEFIGDLHYWRALCALDTDPLTALRDLEHAQATSVVSNDVSRQLAVAAAAATALVGLGRIKELDRWLAVLDQHAQQATIVQPEDVEMRLVPGLLAAVVYRRPWHPMAEALAERAERLLHWEFAPGQRLLLGALAYHLLWRGHVGRLERIVLRIDALSAEQSAAPATRMRWWSVAILVKTLLGQHAAALSDAEQALALVSAEPSVAGQRVSAELLRMIVALACTDAQSAREHMKNASQALHPDQAVERSMLEHQCGILALLEDDRATALRLMRDSVASGHQGGMPMREHIALIANALAAAYSDEHHEAARLLDALFAHPFYAICGWHHWVAGNVAAYAALRRGDVPAALDHLRVTLGVARAHGFRHGPMLFACGEMMARLADLALAHGIEPDVVRDIVLRNQLKAPAQASASWPWPLSMRALGGWHIERADGALPTSRKESKRLIELLHLLVAAGNTPLQQDKLADELWPDADGDAARNALDNALHRLRKWLGGDDRIVLRHGALALNPQRCWTDVAALEHALASLSICAVNDVVSIVQQIRLLYRGPLLPEADAAAISARRAAMAQRVQRGLHLAAERLASAGLHDGAQAVRESLPNL